MLSIHVASRALDPSLHRAQNTVSARLSCTRPSDLPPLFAIPTVPSILSSSTSALLPPRLRTTAVTGRIAVGIGLTSYWRDRQHSVLDLSVHPRGVLGVFEEPAGVAAADGGFDDFHEVLESSIGQLQPFISNSKVGLAKETYALDDEIQIARRDRLPVHKVLLRPHTADTPARLLEDHQLLDHLLLVRIEEPCELRRIQRRVQLEEAAQRRHRALRADVGEELCEMPCGWVCGRVVDVGLQRRGVLIWRRVGSDEFGAGVDEQLFEGLEALVATAKGAKKWMVSFKVR
jgi:hypothetical protein